jgi:hypothetical protein
MIHELVQQRRALLKEVASSVPVAVATGQAHRRVPLLAALNIQYTAPGEIKPPSLVHTAVACLASRLRVETSFITCSLSRKICTSVR